MERYEDSSNVRQPTVHFESATQPTENHTNNSTNKDFSNLHFTPNQRNPHININLPKTQLKTYNGDPLKWHEWYCYFKSTVRDNLSLSDAQKITYLQNSLTDRAKGSVFGYSFNGELYHDAITELKRRFGRPQFVIAACLDKLERWLKPSTDNRDSLISFAAFLRQLLQTFRLHEFTPDLQSSAVLRVAKEKLSPAMIIKWNENVIRKELVNPNFIHFKNLIDKYAEACGDMPRTHNSFYERTHQRGKSEQKINARKICPLCSQSNNLGKYQKLLSENVCDRQQTVRQLHLCPKCLSGHPKGECNSKYRCQIDNCNGFHHSTIHRNNFNTTQPSNQGQKQSTSEYRHNGDNLNRNQFNFTNNSSSWNKNFEQH